jgi:hypothetical protein
LNVKFTAERRGGGTFQGIYWAMVDGRAWRLMHRCEHKHKSRKTAEACAKKQAKRT